MSSGTSPPSNRAVSANPYVSAVHTAYLFGRIDYERRRGRHVRGPAVQAVQCTELLDAVGNPERKIPIVHVAGTKGKGSTSTMIAAVLSAAGYRTGLFTSPHLDRLEERIALDGVNCSSEDLVALVERLRPVVDRMDHQAAQQVDECGPTYFELTTVMALLYFAQHRAQAAVLEVGLGGRLDSTNVCLPQVSVITSISYDHMRQLGNTLAEIAFEKAGIVKPGVPVVSGVTADEPREVIERVCAAARQRRCKSSRDFTYRYYPPHLVDRHASCGRIDFSMAGPPAATYQNVQLGMLGRHQAVNAAGRWPRSRNCNRGAGRLPNPTFAAACEARSARAWKW